MKMLIVCAVLLTGCSTEPHQTCATQAQISSDAQAMLPINCDAFIGDDLIVYKEHNIYYSVYLI